MESPKLKPSKTTTTKSQKKKPPVSFLDPNKAPGKGLSEYQFPEIKHVFPLGLNQSLKWFELVRFARDNDPTDIMASHSQDGEGLANATSDSNVADATANTESEGARESKKRKKTPSGYYHTYECPALNCGGMFKVRSAGRQQPATVNFSSPCTCPLRKQCKDVMKESYHCAQLLNRDLFLYLIEAKAAHIVNMVPVSRDGSRNNGKKKHVSFLSSDNRLFFCTIAKTGESLFKLLKIEESNATISSPVETTTEEVAKATKSCTICQVEATTLYQLSCTCQECEENPYCSKCLTNLYKSRVHAPFHLTDDDFDTEVFAYVNDKVGKCPYCQKFSVTKFVPVGSIEGEELDLPLPYGWIGNHAFMTKAEYESALTIFKASIVPYFADYNSVRLCYVHAERKRETETTDQGKYILRMQMLVFRDFIKFCTTKMYYEVKWAQCNEVVPAVETNEAPVDARTEYAKVDHVKAHYLEKVLLLEHYQTIIQQNKENTQPKDNL